MTAAENAPRRTWFDWLDDAMNPIVVKELRQAVQSRFVVAVLLIFLLLQLVWVGFRLLVVGFRGEIDSIEFQAGKEVFHAQQVILLATCLIFLPLYTAVRLAAERSDANTDLLFVTTIKPRSIVFGKLFSAMVLAVLIISSCTPFMALTYYLRGIDWPSIGVIVGIDFLVVIASVQFVVFLAVIPCHRVFKGLLALGGFTVLCYVFAGTYAMTSEFLQYGVSRLYSMREFWFGAAAFVISVLSVCGLFFTWSVALLSAPSANRALLVRLYSLFIWGTSLVLVAYISSVVGDYIAVLVWMLLMTMLAGLNLVIAIAERRHWSQRVTRTIPRSGPLRALAFLFYSGAAGGVLFATLMMLLTASIGLWCYAADYRGRRWEAEQAHTLVSICVVGFLYTFAYALTAVFLRTHVFRRMATTTTPLIAIVLVAIGSTVPMLIGVLLFMNTWHYDQHYHWLLANPFAGIGEFVHSPHRNARYVFLLTAAIWAGIAFAVNIPWFTAQFRRFRRTEPIEVAKSDG